MLQLFSRLLPREHKFFPQFEEHAGTVRQAAEAIRAMADAIVESARLLERAMPLLSSVTQNAGQLNEMCLQITRIEGRGDELHEQGLKALYEKSKGADAMDFIRGNQ